MTDDILMKVMFNTGDPVEIRVIPYNADDYRDPERAGEYCIISGQKAPEMSVEVKVDGQRLAIVPAHGGSTSKAFADALDMAEKVMQKRVLEMLSALSGWPGGKKTEKEA